MVILGKGPVKRARNTHRGISNAQNVAEITTWRRLIQAEKVYVLCICAWHM